jgi:hypothetical protein
LPTPGGPVRSNTIPFLDSFLWFFAINSSILYFVSIIPKWDSSNISFENLTSQKGSMALSNGSLKT